MGLKNLDFLKDFYKPKNLKTSVFYVFGVFENLITSSEKSDFPFLRFFTFVNFSRNMNYDLWRLRGLILACGS